MTTSKSQSSLQAQLGQVFIVGFDGTEMSSRLSSLLARIQPAGVVLFARNIISAEQTYVLLKECQKYVSMPLFTCVDMEGGRVDRLKNAIAPAPAPAEVFASGDRKLFRKHGKLIGESCRAAGFNVDFAPALDLAFEASRSVMGSRAVSADPKQVVVYAREFIAGLESAGVIGCGKHFPGLGEANLDTHHELPSVKKSLKRLWNEDIVPYRTLRRELPMVMISHAAYGDVTGDHNPASLSRKWITEILRKKIGYRGLVVSDDLEMGGVLKAAPIEQAAIGHIRAGGDLALICHQEEFITRSYEAMIRETEKDRKFAARIAESSKRVAAFKRKTAALRRRTPPPRAEKLQRLSRELWEFAEQLRFASLGREVQA